MNVRPTICLLAVATLAVPALACGDVDSPGGAGISDGSAARMQDSADVVIVENPRPADGSRLNWRVGPEAAVTIGRREGEDPYLLHGVTDATRLSDGRIVVVSYGTFELRVFDESGIHVDTWGGRGEGPNEFEATIRNIARLPGDTVMVWNSAHSIMSVVAPTGEVARRFRVQEPAERQGDHLRPVAVLRDGSILTSPTPAFYGTDVQVELRENDAHFERYIEDRVSGTTDPEARARVRERVSAVPVSDRFPAFASMMADALDHLWVEEYEPPGEELPGVIWCVFDPEGRVLGFVETPEGLEIYDIGEDYILGRVTDEMDVEFIQLWPLERVEA